MSALPQSSEAETIQERGKNSAPERGSATRSNVLYKKRHRISQRTCLAVPQTLGRFQFIPL